MRPARKTITKFTSTDKPSGTVYYFSRATLSHARRCSSCAASETARAHDEAAMQRGRKKSAVSGQRGLMRAPLMGDFFASWITFWFALPGAQDSRLFRNSARFGAARRRLLLPAHMGRHIHQRTHCRHLQHLLRGDFTHSSAGGSLSSHRHLYCQRRCDA